MPEQGSDPPNENPFASPQALDSPQADPVVRDKAYYIPRLMIRSFFSSFVSILAGATSCSLLFSQDGIFEGSLFTLAAASILMAIAIALMFLYHAALDSSVRNTMQLVTFATYGIFGLAGGAYVAGMVALLF